MQIKRSSLLIITAIFLFSCSSSDDSIDPTNSQIKYGKPLEVNIDGYTADAMEPFISPDGTTLYFNSLNDGNNTKLYYATKTNTTTFTFKGELIGANEINPSQLNAVADLDSNNNFYWTSVREYPDKRDNLHFGTLTNGTVTNIARVQGDFYILESGWILMDHGVNYDGSILYYNNARFDDTLCLGPCETQLGIAQKTSQGNFEKISNSDDILQNISNANYIYYAPNISKDNLELYYTRYLKENVNSNTIVEICIATRTSNNAIFSEPKVLFSNTLENGIIEAPTLTTDKQFMYYHKKINGLHKIMVRERE